MCALLSQWNRLIGSHVAFLIVKVDMFLFQLPSMISSLSFIFHTYEFINDLQDMHLALLKGGFQWSFLIYQRLLKLKSMFIMIFLLPLYEVFHSL